MNIALVDDDSQQMELLKNLICSQLGNQISLDCFSSGEDFLASFQGGRYDLIILDIFMGEMTGIETAKKIRRTDELVRLVFSTTSNEFASESYEVNACYYLHKPLDEEKIRQMLDRINLEALERSRAITLKDGTSVVLRSVIYADSDAHYITFHRKEGEPIVTRLPFSVIEPQLSEYSYFFSPMKGIIINFHEVSFLTADMVRMSDGSSLPVSRRKTKLLAESYNEFRFTKLRKEGDC